MRRDEEEKKMSCFLRCRGMSSVVGAISVWPGSDHPQLCGRNRFVEAPKQSYSADSFQLIANSSTFSSTNKISQYFFYGLNILHLCCSGPTFPPHSSICFTLTPPPSLFPRNPGISFYEFLNCDFRTLIACVLITSELRSLWGFTNSPLHLNWLHKSNRKE